MISAINNQDNPAEHVRNGSTYESDYGHQQEYEYEYNLCNDVAYPIIESAPCPNAFILLARDNPWKSLFFFATGFNDSTGQLPTYTYMHRYMHAHSFTDTYAYICFHMCTNPHTRMYAHEYVYACIHTYVHELFALCSRRITIKYFLSFSFKVPHRILSMQHTGWRKRRGNFCVTGSCFNSLVCWLPERLLLLPSSLSLSIF